MTAPDASSTAARLAATPTDGDGTPEEHWRAWLGSREWPPLDLPVDRLVVLGAHPDDEVLGVGGIMTAAALAGIEVLIICMSDGAGSHPGSPTLTPAQLAVRRHIELDTATKLLGLGPAHWRGLADGGLATEHDTMIQVIEHAVGDPGNQRTGLLSVWSRDGHPDHEAVGRCAIEVARRHALPLWMYPVWMWHWAHPADSAVPWDRLRVRSLPPSVVAAKHAAISCFDTQVRPLSPAPADRPVLTPQMLAHMIRHEEYVFA